MVDRGGTFCDCIGIVDGKPDIVIKLLSVDPSNYDDAPTEGIRRILETATGKPHPRGMPLDSSQISLIRMGTTIATNALLERKGERSALLITKGFGDSLEIGHQSRPNLFELNIRKPSVLYEKCIEIDERVAVEHAYAEDAHVGSLTDGVGGEKIRILKPLGEFQCSS